MNRLYSESHLITALNAKKTEVMVIGRHTSSIIIMYNGAPLEQAKKYIYLGASFNEKGDATKQVKRRVSVAKRSMGDLHRTWMNKELLIPLKGKLVQLNDLADNELCFRDLDLFKASAEHDKCL